MSTKRVNEHDRSRRRRGGVGTLIAELGTASEVELQAKTLKSLETLREELSDLEKHGIVRRRSGIFKVPAS